MGVDVCVGSAVESVWGLVYFFSVQCLVINSCAGARMRGVIATQNYSLEYFFNAHLKICNYCKLLVLYRQFCSKKIDKIKTVIF